MIRVDMNIPSARSGVRKAGRFFLIMLSGLLAFILVLAGVLLVWSPGRQKPFMDEKGKIMPQSISEKIFVRINGVEQGMFIKGKDVRNPVLLFLHGGPGMPEYFLSQDFPTDLEDGFTVVWWEQRGSGLSYSTDIPSETMTSEQLISDVLAVTNYLRSRFGKEKVYLMGHSWGSFLGIQAAARAPELYHAYIGMGQMSYQGKSEVLAYNHMLKRFKENGDDRMVRKLEAAPITAPGPLPKSYDSLRDAAMHGLGIGTTHKMKSVVTGIFLPSWKCRDYTIMEKVNIWRGKSYSRSFDMWNQIMTTDLATLVPELKLPVYFCQGIFDYTCSYQLALAYLKKLKAPVKGFYTFKHSAHSPLFEEPAKMRTILFGDVLAGVNDHADAI